MQGALRAARGAQILQGPDRNESLDGWSQGLAILGKESVPSQTC